MSIKHSELKSNLEKGSFILPSILEGKVDVSTSLGTFKVTDEDGNALQSPSGLVPYYITVTPDDSVEKDTFTAINFGVSTTEAGAISQSFLPSPFTIVGPSGKFSKLADYGGENATTDSFVTCQVLTNAFTVAGTLHFKLYYF